jgi:catechol 2,3-dioxygenase-like lactoylglutathione lyase family enzyme
MKARVRRPSNTGRLHHVEVYVSDLNRGIAFWERLLVPLGYIVYQQWDSGRSWKLGDTYIVLVQAPSDQLAHGFHRRRVGLNHLAFHARSRRQVDQLTAELQEHGGRLLYGDRHPYAGGYYAAYVEDPDGIKVEIVAPSHS